MKKGDILKGEDKDISVLSPCIPIPEVVAKLWLLVATPGAPIWWLEEDTALVLDVIGPHTWILLKLRGYYLGIIASDN